MNELSGLLLGDVVKVQNRCDHVITIGDHRLGRGSVAAFTVRELRNYSSLESYFQRGDLMIVDSKTPVCEHDQLAEKNRLESNAADAAKQNAQWSAELAAKKARANRVAGAVDVLPADASSTDRLAAIMSVKP